MKNFTSPSYFSNIFLLLFLMFISIKTMAQVGIGTTTPDSSSIMDIKSSSKGVLVPRMTSQERTRIPDPANALVVYDKDEKSFFYYDARPSNSRWIKISSDYPVRDNYKLIKSAADLASELDAGGGSKYLLNESTFYEINGSIVLDVPIDLNNAYVAGMDSNEDVLIGNGGIVFQGNKGGSIRNLTITGRGSVFDITGGTSLIVQNTIITNMASVGAISGVGLYFGNIIQYLENENGITYSDIGNLLLSNQGWFDSNSGVYETFKGTFNLIEKVSGFSTVNNDAIAMDFTNNPSVNNGVILSVVFSGNSNLFVKGYSTGSYVGYNFTNSWTVDCPGIPHESDGVATGDINLSLAVNNGATTTFTANNRPKKILGITSSHNLLRFKKNENNRIVYEGKKKRFFQVTASVSYQSTGSHPTYILYIAKNGSIVTDSKVYGKAASGFFPSGILAVPIVATIELNPNDYIEAWVERSEGDGDFKVIALNLTAK